MMLMRHHDDDDDDDVVEMEGHVESNDVEGQLY